jgi:hypothetical protein
MNITIECLTKLSNYLSLCLGGMGLYTTITNIVNITTDDKGVYARVDTLHIDLYWNGTNWEEV